MVETKRSLDVCLSVCVYVCVLAAAPAWRQQIVHCLWRHQQRLTAALINSYSY